MDERINILIVDDEPKNLTVLETILNDPDYSLIRAESADQALLALVVEEFALLILDIRMPGMTGFELAKMIKERKKTAKVPIIFLTAYYNEDQHVIAGYDSGAVDYLHKPVNPAILRSKVAVFAELYRKNREIEMINRSLLAEVTTRRRTEEELHQVNQTLEQRVSERTEALQETDKRKNEFLATLAHELRNPLAPLRNAVELFHLKGLHIPELQWAAEVINRQTRTLARLIDDLMDLSRINEGRIELKREQVLLSNVIESAIEASQPHIREMNHELTVTLPHTPVTVNADITRLAQVFLNLLNNAAKYTERGGRIELHVAQQGSDAVVSIKDTGIGIPPDKLKSIFQMFSQVDGSLSRSLGGLGIGLSLAQRLVEMHSGRIEAFSDGLGSGSKFVVRLPIVAAAPQAHAPRREDRAPRASELRILVVDDNRDAAATLAMLLKSTGSYVRTAHDGEEAIQVAAEFLPNVVLCDIGLPKMDGYEVGRHIRQEPWGEKMTLIAVTGWGQDDDRRKSDEAGFDRHLVKPVDPNALMNLLAGLDGVKV